MLSQICYYRNIFCWEKIVRQTSILSISISREEWRAVTKSAVRSMRFGAEFQSPLQAQIAFNGDIFGSDL
jgi:hypothetical protein